MLISPALAGHGVVDTGSPGGGIAVLVILGVVIAVFLAHVGQKRWRRRRLKRDGDDE
jgi:hypothetical protein